MPLLFGPGRYLLGGGGRVVRGLGQGFTSRIIDGSPTLGGWAMTSRIRHRTHVLFFRSRVRIPTFTTHNGVDTDLANDFDFQVGIETAYTSALTGIAARAGYVFSGVNGSGNTASYRAASGPRGYITSDWLYHSAVADGTFFGIWTTVQQTQHTNNLLPNNGLASNFFNKFEGRNFTTTDQIAANYAISSTSIAGAYASTQTGDPTYPYFGPGCLEIDYPRSAKVPLIVGHSIPDGSGESASGSASAGSNQQGSQYNNAGYVARGIDETLGWNYAAKITLPGDSFANLATAANSVYRRQWMTISNPTHIFMDLGTNDVAAGTGLSAIAANQLTVTNLYRAAVPGVKIIQPTILPRTNTTDAYATKANQADQTGFLAGRGASYNNTYIRALSAAIGIDGYWDLDPLAADGVDSNRWLSGSANFATGDGIHPNSVMHATIAAGMTQGLSA